MFLLYNKNMSEFKLRFSLEKRKEETLKIMAKYPDKIPVVVEKNPNCKIQQIDKSKFLVPKDVTVAQFLYIIRKRIKLLPQEAMFIFVNNKLPFSNMLMSELYNKEKEECGFLFCTYSSEQTFG